MLAAAQSGGQWAYERLYRWLAPAVVGYLRVQGAAEPDDLTSEVFERVFSSLGGFSGDEARFRSWVFTIAHHRLTDAWRRAARRPVRADQQPPEHPGGDVEDEAARRLATERVRALCDGFVPDQRDVLLLPMLGALTVDEIAAALGKSTGGVKALQRRGLAAIRRQMEREGVPLRAPREFTPTRCPNRPTTCGSPVTRCWPPWPRTSGSSPPGRRRSPGPAWSQ